MSVCRTGYDIFSVKEWRDLETRGRGRSRSVKMAPFDRLYDFLLVGHCKHSCMLYDIEKVTEGHSNWYHAKDLVRFPIRLS